jgi:hypothetical protein
VAIDARGGGNGDDNMRLYSKLGKEEKATRGEELMSDLEIKLYT